MTNERIIINESIKLMKDGILQGSGVFAEVELADGKKRIE